MIKNKHKMEKLSEAYRLELEYLNTLSDKEFKRDYQEYSCREALAEFRVGLKN
jgi:hypothetical protein